MNINYYIGSKNDSGDITDSTQVTELGHRLKSIGGLIAHFRIRTPRHEGITAYVGVSRGWKKDGSKKGDPVMFFTVEKTVLNPNAFDKQAAETWYAFQDMKKKHQLIGYDDNGNQIIGPDPGGKVSWIHGKPPTCPGCSSTH